MRMKEHCYTSSPEYGDESSVYPTALSYRTLRACVYWINWAIKRLWGTCVRT